MFTIGTKVIANHASGENSVRGRVVDVDGAWHLVKRGNSLIGWFHRDMLLVRNV